MPAHVFRDVVTARCAELGLSRHAVAERAGVGRSSLFAWLSGTASPTASALTALADALEVDVVKLLELVGAPEPGPVTVARLRRGWSRSQLARRARVSIRTVAQVEAAEPVRSDAAGRVARALGVSHLLGQHMMVSTQSRTRLGGLLETARCRRGWTVARLGRQFGVSRQMASAWLRGTEPVAEARLVDVADFLRLPVDQVRSVADIDRTLRRPAAGVGSRLRDLRVAAGWTQAELAARVRVSASSVEHWEMGLRAPGEATRSRLAAELGVAADTFTVAA